MSYSQLLNKEARKRSSARLTGKITDEAGLPINGAVLSTLTLTLYDEMSLTIINNRLAQNVLNINGGSVDANGNLIMILSPADNILIDNLKNIEIHVALFSWTWDGGTKAGNYDIGFPLKNVSKVN